MDRNAFELASDPRENIKKPEREEPVPYLDFSPLQNVLSDLKTTIEQYDMINLNELPEAKKDMLNTMLMDAEQALTSEKGLPRRPWFKHQIYAPGFYTGYGVKTLPGVREAIEQKNWKEAREQITVLSETLSNFNSHLKKIVSSLK